MICIPCAINEKCTKGPISKILKKKLQLTTLGFNRNGLALFLSITLNQSNQTEVSHLIENLHRRDIHMMDRIRSHFNKLIET